MRQILTHSILVCAALSSVSAAPLVSLRAETPIKVSKETTFITEPLRDDGLPDYERYLRERFSQGVTPENNAAVLLWQAMGPGGTPPDDFAAITKAIGMKQVPKKEQLLQSISAMDGADFRETIAVWLQSQKVLPPKPESDTELDHWKELADEAAFAVIEMASSQPWTAEQIPPMGTWVDQNKRPFGLLVEASKRSRFDTPDPDWLNDRRDKSEDAIWLGDVFAARSAVAALTARAMYRIGHGSPNQAWEDILATYRFAKLSDQRGGFLIDSFIASANLNAGLIATLVLLDNAKLSEDQADSILKELNALQAPANFANNLDCGERIGMLMQLIDMMEGEVEPDPFGLNAEVMTIASSGPLDWNVVFKECNRQYDEIVAAAKLGSNSEREDALKIFIDELDDVNHQTLLHMSRAERSVLLSSSLIKSTAGWVQTGVNSLDRTSTNLSLVRLAAALTVYRAQHGVYPERLDDLKPAIVQELPVDLFHQHPFVYRRTDNGYLLYSKGPNGNDDAGDNKDFEIYRGYRTKSELHPSVQSLLGNEMPQITAPPESPTPPKSPDDFDIPHGPLYHNIPEDADDIAIRVPLPKLELPKAK